MPDETPVLMIVDDEKDFVLELSESLTSHGYETLIAHNGVEALQMLERRVRELGNVTIGAVLSDWVMEGGNGIELLAKMRQTEALRSIPFVLVSGQVSREELQSAIRMDADAVLLKPFDAEKVMNKVHEAALLREAKDIRKGIVRE